MSYGDIIGGINEAAKLGSKFGTERARALLDALGSPDKGLKIIHVAGTNGKGSCSAFISNALKAAGKSVGTFTSPQVFSYEEQFCVNCVPLERRVTEKYISMASAAAEAMEDKPSAFEIETAAAFEAFRKEGCEYAVIECGLGGRDDATNAVANKVAAAITSVSIEHTAELGGTITEICRAKSGIIKDCPAVVSAMQTEEGTAFFKQLGAIFAGEGLEVIKSSAEGQTFKYKGETYSVKMYGSAQCFNAAVAIEVCRILGLSLEDIRRGITQTAVEGRCQTVIKGEVTYILDGAHNPAAFKPLTELLAFCPKPAALVFGCLSDKDVCGAAEALAPHFRSAVLFSPKSYRAMELERIYGAFKGKIEVITTAETVEAALSKAAGKTVVVCGSFTALKEAREWIEKRQ